MATRKEYDGYDAATSIKSNDLIKYKDGSSGKVYKITEANLSAQVQDDLMSNDAVTEATVSTDTVPILASGENANITLQNLMIQMKGYKEYTALITQSGTNTPVLTVLKDELDGTITATRSNVGEYNIESSNNDFPQDKTAIFFSPSVFCESVDQGEIKYLSCNWGNINHLDIWSTNYDNSTGVEDVVGWKAQISIRVYL